MPERPGDGDQTVTHGSVYPATGSLVPGYINHSPVWTCNNAVAPPGETGVIQGGSIIPLASVTDGTSNTALFCEAAQGWVSASDFAAGHVEYRPWNTTGDTWIDFQFAPNPRRYTPSNKEFDYDQPASMHPGGLKRLLHGRLGSFHQGLGQSLARSHRPRLRHPRKLRYLHRSYRFDEPFHCVRNGELDGRRAEAWSLANARHAQWRRRCSAPTRIRELAGDRSAR